MSPLAILKLVGFATGAALHLYLCGLLIQRRGVQGVARVVLWLGATVGFWHLGNFLATTYELLEVRGALWWLKSGHGIAYVALALLPPIGFHAQMRVWEWMDDPFETPPLSSLPEQLVLPAMKLDSSKLAPV